jgi:hypothetical protein
MSLEESYINERLDHLGIAAGVCQELGSRLARCPRSHSSPTGKRWKGHGSHDPEWLRVQQPYAKAWIGGYHQGCLLQKDEATLDTYLRILRQFTAWVAERPGHSRHLVPSQLTMTVVELYLSVLKEQGFSVSLRARVKTVINGFCQWLIEEKQALSRNPARRVEIKSHQSLAPSTLSPDQRFVLRNLL